MNKLGYAMAQQAVHILGQPQSSAPTFALLDLEWDQLDGVLGGDFNVATECFASWLPYGEAHSFLEMGAGSGVTSVIAALRGCRAVTALDINPAAVRNTAMNAQRHGVGDRVRALESDLFRALGENETFDLIYWNSPFVEAPADRSLESYLEYAFFDPGYSMHRAFLRAAPGYLTDTGRIFLGFSMAMGNPDLVHDLAREANLRSRPYKQQNFSFPLSALEWAHDPADLAELADDAGLVHADFTLLELHR